MRIRTITSRDIPAAAKVLRAEFGKPPYNETASMPMVIKSLRHFLSLGTGFVALEKNQIVGVVYFRISQFWAGPTMEIEDLAVKDGFKGKGIGKKLLAKAEAFDRKKKVVHVLLITSRKAGTQSFYTQKGYQLMKDSIFFKKKLK